MNTIQHNNSYENISERETDIVRLLALGYNSREIGDMLFISEHTVNTHRRNMVRKLDLRNTYQLIGWAFRQRVLSF
ncbi:MAG: response regulator transcription factor [Pedobacter sp.]|nr:response regulator transcription factor [Pedobacter sp.]